MVGCLALIGIICKKLITMVIIMAIIMVTIMATRVAIITDQVLQISTNKAGEIVGVSVLQV